MEYLTFDIEAHNWVNFKLAGVYDGRIYREFRTAKKLLAFMLRPEYKGYSCFAHFGGGYDFKFLLPVLCDSGIDFEIIDSGGRILFIKTSGITLIDSYNLLRGSLADITEAFDVSHKKLKIDFRSLGENDFYSPRVREYLKNDVIGLYESLSKFKDWGYNGGTLKSTLPAQSLHIFKQNFAGDEYKSLARLSLGDDKFIRKGYYGGRVEIFRMTGRGLNYYDVNSLYPYVMSFPMPCGEYRNVTKYVSGKAGFYHIKVKIPPSVKIPFIPYVMGKKLFFPCGTFPAYVTDVDAELLKERGFGFKVIRGIVFDGKNPYFKDYISRMYDIKSRAVPGSMEYFIAKLAMNSLYGKFGQKLEREKIVHCSMKKAFDEGLRVYDDRLDLYIKEEVRQPKFSFPYISSYITSLARRELLFILEKCRDAYYCDTDSVITTDRLTVGKALGRLKLEHSGIEEGVFLQPKTYSLKTGKGKGVMRVKGFSDTTQLTHAIFKRALFEKNLALLENEQSKICGHRESIVRFGSFDIRRISYTKRITSFYDKRRVMPDFSTLPLTFNDISL